jgi:alpha-2-macroglobulin
MQPPTSPCPGLEVRLYDSAGVEVGSLVTARDGTGSTPIPHKGYWDILYAAAGEPGDPDFAFASTSWNRGIHFWTFGLPSGSSAESFAYAYTDRPIYMPGQTVYLRANLHRQENGRYFMPDSDQVHIQVYGDYSILSGEMPLIAELSLPLSVFGSASGEFILPEDAEPGTYTVRIKEAPESYLSFQVAEYRKPEIDLQVAFDAETYLRDEEIVIAVDARYFFGAPAANQHIQWSLFASDDPHNLPGGYQTGALNLDRNDLRYAGFNDRSLADYALTGEDGSVEIRITASDVERLLETGSRRRLVFEASLAGEAEFSTSARASAVLHPADFVIGVRSEAYTVRAGADAGFSILTTDLNGSPSGSKILQARFQQLTWPDQSRRTFNEPVKTVFETIGSADFQTGRDGRARLVFTPTRPGVYQLEVTGGNAVTQVLVWVGGEGAPIWPRLPDAHILLQADRASYQPGDTARVFVPNPFGAGARALVTVERGKVMRSEVLAASGPSLELSIPIQPEDAPNVYVSVVLIGSNSSGYPDFRMGYLELGVDPGEQLLAVQLVGDPQVSEPGGEVTFTLQVNDSAGQPVEGSFSLALVDKAVLALAPPNAVSIIDAYYGRQPLGVYSSLSLAAYTRRIDMSTPEGGGGGGGPGVAAFIRSQFEDTAYWNGTILTGPDGRATVTVKVPDNLTTWVALVRGLDRDARVGEAEIEVITTKPLLVRPHAPRFLVAGDRVVLGMHVHNNTIASLNVSARLEAAGFDLDNPDRAVQVVTVPSGGQRYVFWDGVAQPVDKIDLVFSAQAGELRDAATPDLGPLPVVKYRAPSTFGTAGVLAEAGERLEIVALPRTFTPSGGSLQVELSPSLAAALLDALQVRQSYPGGFTEAVLSRFLPNIQALAALRGLGYASPQLEAELESEIKTGIVELSGMQNRDGGWGMVGGGQSSTHISAYVLFGLAHAAANGQTVDEHVIEGGRAYLLENLITPDAGTQTGELDRLAFQHFALQGAGARSPDLQRLYHFYEDMSPWAQGLLALTLSDYDPQDTQARQIVMKLKDSVRRSATGVHWEAQSQVASFYTPMFNNAVVVYTLAKLDPAASLLPDAVRYLLSARRPGGLWASSYETAWSLLALTQALQGTADLQADYAYAALLDGSDLARGQAAPGALDPVRVEVSLDRLREGTGSELRIQRQSGSGRLYYRSFLQLYSPVESAEPVAKGVHIERRYYQAGQDCRTEACIPQETFAVNPQQQVLVRLTLTLPESMHYLVVQDSIPAGAEIVDTSLLTTAYEQTNNTANPFEEGWHGWMFGQPKIFSDRIWWAAEYVPAGTYELVYRMQPLFKGEFRVLPAHAYQYYFPDVEGTSGGGVVTFR